MTLRTLVAAAALAGLAGCSDTAGRACTAVFVYGLNLEIRDAVTGAPAADGATATARDGAYTETLEPVPGPETNLVRIGAGERPGTYDVTVTKPGFVTWERRVTVTADECHVHPVLLDVRLSPTP
jgi:hypothetical protein